jgi:Zn-dependent peptidase ImmA (M78 family)
LKTQDIGRLVLDLIADVDIRRVTKKELGRHFNRGAVAGIEDDYKKQVIYIDKSLNHAETVRSLLHELSHYYSSKYENIPWENHDEDVIERRAADWQRALYVREVRK